MIGWYISIEATWILASPSISLPCVVQGKHHHAALPIVEIPAETDYCFTSSVAHAQGLMTEPSHMSRWGVPPTFWMGVRTTPPTPNRSSKPAHALDVKKHADGLAYHSERPHLYPIVISLSYQVCPYIS